MIRPAHLLACALFCAVSGCKPAFDVRLASPEQSLPHPSFVVQERDADDGQRPRYHTIRVIQLPEKQLVWHLRANPFGTDASQSNLQYGVVPAGFEALQPAQDLLPNHEYALVVSGAAHGELRFRTDAQGALSAAP